MIVGKCTRVSHTPVGLTSAEAKERLLLEGPNEIPPPKPRTALRIALEVLREPMFLLLVSGGAIYLVMGEVTDASMLLGFVVVVFGITVVQERRTERALESLRSMAAPRARVVRDGVEATIAGREVVRGDLLIVGEGDRVAADGLLREGTHLLIDESLLTGESVAVNKKASLEAVHLGAPNAEGPSAIFAGTLVIAGQGRVEVLRTGPRSEFGRIGTALGSIEQGSTPLHQETLRLVRLFAALGLGASAFVVVAYALVRGGGAQAWKEALLAGIATAMSLLPEEFPVVLTVFLALGAYRIAKKNVLARRMSAVEALGSATVLCVDKTGTLTKNQMTLRAMWRGEQTWDISARGERLTPPLEELLTVALFASRPNPFDPMERALWSALEMSVDPEAKPLHGWLLEREYPLSATLSAVRYVWSHGQRGERVLTAKGAPEAILELCGAVGAERVGFEQAVATLAAQGLRVLAVARSRATAELDVGGQSDSPLEFLGLLGFEDPLRPEAAAAVSECRRAGIRVMMITGDSPLTATTIARQAGLDRPELVLTGKDLTALSDEELGRELRRVQVFARVAPEQKLRLVRALMAQGEVVAMTGDGVNDAPALKAAHIGVAMGQRGTDVAREASSLVLLDDAFSSIVEAIRLGRRTFDNIKKAFAFIFAVHVPIAGLSLLPLLIPGAPLLLYPVQIVFLELIIDPACSVVFEYEHIEANVMGRPPRRPDAPLFSRSMIGLCTAQGMIVFAVCSAVFFEALPSHSFDTVRALTFTTLVTSMLALVFTNRSWQRSIFESLRAPNHAFWLLTSVALLILSLVLGWPAATRLFHFGEPALTEVLLAFAAGFSCIFWLGALKWIWPGTRGA
jgi:P-type Ca2+ transporter type 2C